ncbi:glycoside-pentoside-hexuronide (GPH):cation symporter [Paenibacillus sp. URB8-2]|uniref:glycoside-pentoside-hexuronide (GPH):cation symporter n=1 Tax=Paenibacillus sp. URB8-2 TaxID=2741301 RepID=UPI0015B7DE3D|nr:glycoside-pentoside-hexuronide (GPH):cation symporter [Paenibacillus sp. URB8-2]BCG57257.1 PTS sugar transporter subunit IIA [Paenibacillus sp. URB8-2]
MENSKGNIVSRLSYSFGAFGNDLLFGLLSTYFIMFVTTHLFNSGNKAQDAKMIGFITLIIFFLRFVELAIDPFIGNAIDNTHTRWGKFKPWVVVGGVLGPAALVILFTDFGGLTKSNPMLYLILFAILYIMMDILYSFKDIAFWSMIPALSFDSREREKTATFARIGSNVGGGTIGIVVMPLVLLFSLHANDGTGDSRGWFWFALIIGCAAALSAVVVGLGTKEVDSDLRKNKEATTFKGVFRVLMHNDQLMWLSLAYGLYAIGMSLTNSFELYYFTFILGDASKFSILALLNTIVGLAAVSIFPALAKKWNRRNVFLVAIALMLIGLVVFSLANSSLILVLVAAELFFIPQPLIFLVALMTITDSVEYGQLKLGHRDESLTLSVRPLLDKLAGAISNLVVGITAVAASMTAGATAATITNHDRFIFKFAMLGVPAVIILVGAFVFFKKVKLDEKMHASIVDELERTWAKGFDRDDESESTGSQPNFKAKLSYYAPVAGEVIPLEQVSDAVFSTGSMGRGFAIKPSDGRVYAPFDGVIEATFSTRHTVGLVSENKIATLIHIGIGTVKMNGTGFITYFEPGQRVSQGELLIEFWSPAIKKAGLDDTVIAVITNSDNLSEFEIKNKGEVTKNDIVLTLEKK